MPVYVVVSEGVTNSEPLGTGVTEPIPRLILKDVALLVVHKRFDDEPSTTVGSDAVSVQVGGGSTVTVAVHVLVPPAPVTVPV